ncbi:MAG: DUF5663 domain-containing protein [Patescibacteria group bacterium]
MDNQTTGQINFDDAQKKLIEELGLSELPIEKQAELLEKMSEAVLKRIFVETLEKLNEEDKKSYAEMVERQDSPEEVDVFLKEKIPNYEGFVQGIINEFKEAMKKEV